MALIIGALAIVTARGCWLAPGASAPQPRPAHVG